MGYWVFRQCFLGITRRCRPSWPRSSWQVPVVGRDEVVECWLRAPGTGGPHPQSGGGPPERVHVELIPV